MPKIKIGDKIKLKPLKVEAVSDTSYSIIASGLTFNRSYIESVSPRAFVVGDRVQMRGQFDEGTFATVIGIDEDVAWLKWTVHGYGHISGDRNFHRSVDLVRIDPA